MIVYLDTSALVKLYVQEVGSREMKRLVAQADLVATSLIAYVEVRSAFARKHRSADIDDAALKRHKHEFEQGWNRLDRLPVDVTTIRRAGDLAEEYRLKAYDALHLATVDLMQVTLRSSVSFACFDDALNRAAAKMGFALIAEA
ncbi:MAG: type II toxin-antitoxin system VapC family toxin [Candidatus Binatus sp.]|uniref:type II toxin-antitoxin system VapC family toxin n=1 Tax=Candidatus Binatus sp. TaxID=2811406 RepID=UPI003BB11A1C